MAKYFITGVCGTVGKEMARQILSRDSNSEIIGVDNNEAEVFFINQELGFSDRFKAYYCDIRDLNDLVQRSRGSEIFLHTAALKHVTVCEDSPDQAVLSNIIGTQNCILAAKQNITFKRFLFTSSDKAVNPTNVMGTTKLMGERLVTAASTDPYSDCIFASTRFGNVIGSRGSVVPIFRRQISNNKPVTVTHPNMTRFIMSLNEAVSLVLESLEISQSGDVIITKMPVARIIDIAHVMLEHAQKASLGIEFVGIKPGEKLYEELNNSEEASRTDDIGRFLRVKPALQVARNADLHEPNNLYNSDLTDPISKLELANKLVQWEAL